MGGGILATRRSLLPRRWELSDYLSGGKTLFRQILPCCMQISRRIPRRRAFPRTCSTHSRVTNQSQNEGTHATRARVLYEIPGCAKFDVNGAFLQNLWSLNPSVRLGGRLFVINYPMTMSGLCSKDLAASRIFWFLLSTYIDLKNRGPARIHLHNLSKPRKFASFIVLCLRLRRSKYDKCEAFGTQI